MSMPCEQCMEYASVVELSVDAGQVRNPLHAVSAFHAGVGGIREICEMRSVFERTGHVQRAWVPVSHVPFRRALEPHLITPGVCARRWRQDLGPDQFCLRLGKADTRPSNRDVSQVITCGPPMTTMHPRRRAQSARSRVRWNCWLCTPTNVSSVRPPWGRLNRSIYRTSAWTLLVDRYESISQLPAGLDDDNSQGLGHTRTISSSFHGNEAFRPA